MRRGSSKSQPFPNSNIEILFENTDSRFIPITHSSYELEGKTFCFYFPQIQEIFYQSLTRQEQKRETLEKFVRNLMQDRSGKMYEGINWQEDELAFETFDKHNQNITPRSPLSFRQCSRVKVYLQKEYSKISIEAKTKLTIRPKKQIEVIVNMDQHRKMRAFQLFIQYNLQDYKFTSLMIDSCIIRHYQNLQDLELSPGTHNAYPLFAFQTFYHDMHTIYNYLVQQKFTLQQLIFDYGRNSQENTVLEQRYNLFTCSSIDRITQCAIIYLSSEFYQPQSHKKYLALYTNGKIGNILTNRQSQMISTMVNHLQKYPSDDSKHIFVYERIEEETNQLFKKDQIVRIETFSPAVEKEREELNGRYFIFQIEHITAKNIVQFNCSKTNYTHIILPYNEYLVTNCTKEGRHYRVNLVELPTPKCLNTHLFIIISDNINETRQFQAKMQEVNSLRFETILLKDSKMYQIWLKKYYNIISARKYCIIYSKSNVEQGMEVVLSTEKLLGRQTSMMIYANFSEEDHDKFASYSNVIITKSNKTALCYIFQCLADEKITETPCNACQCEIY